MTMKCMSGLIVSVFLMIFLPLTVLKAQNVGGEQLVKIESSKGTMIIKLYDETPAHRDNMIKLIKEGFYTDLLFHRVIPNFMIQGGDPESRGAEQGIRLGNGGPGYTVPAEFNPALFHKKGAISAARMGDATNPERASSGSQFYLVQGRVYTPEQLESYKSRGAVFTPESEEAYTTIGGTPHLDGAYTVFGEVVEGLEIIDSIASQARDAYDRPLEDVIFSISLDK